MFGSEKYQGKKNMLKENDFLISDFNVKNAK